MSGRLIDYMGTGNVADRPNPVTLAAALTSGAVAFYFAEDENLLYVLDRNGTATWLTITPGSAGFDPDLTIVDETGTARNNANSESGNYIFFSNASAKTYTLQPNATEALDAGWNVSLRNTGAGDLTITEGSGVTATPPNGGTLAVPQNGTVSIVRSGSNAFHVMGQVNAV